jgi:hypothetical protein
VEVTNAAHAKAPPCRCRFYFEQCKASIKRKRRFYWLVSFCLFNNYFRVVFVQRGSKAPIHSGDADFPQNTMLLGTPAPTTAPMWKHFTMSRLTSSCRKANDL